ncbi:MAG: hypothetical protein AAF197_03835, partial [Pseudomonadota bacterium]
PLINSVMLPVHAQTSCDVSNDGAYRGVAGPGCIGNSCIEIVVSGCDVSVSFTVPLSGIPGFEGTGMIENGEFDLLAISGQGTVAESSLEVSGQLNSSGEISGDVTGGTNCDPTSGVSSYTAILNAGCP